MEKAGYKFLIIIIIIICQSNASIFVELWRVQHKIKAINYLTAISLA